MKAEAQNHSRLTCEVETTLKVIGGRWKVLIIRELMDGVKRFGELQRALDGITRAVSSPGLTTPLMKQKTVPLPPRTSNPEFT